METLETSENFYYNLGKSVNFHRSWKFQYNIENDRLQQDFIREYPGKVGKNEKV